MDQQKQKLQNLHQSSFSNHSHKKLIQLAISFSVLSFLFLHPSWSSFFHSFISYLPPLSSQIFALATDKNYIFLLCNGILVFIAKYSGQTVDTRPPKLPDTSLDNDLMYKAYRQSMQLPTEKSVLMEDVVTTNKDQNGSETDINEVMQEEDVEEKHVLYENTYETPKEKEDDVINNDNEEEHMKEQYNCWSYEEQQTHSEIEEHEEEEEEAIAKLSTEELNRKFDDFIRKMKEDLRFEARQQLIVV